MPAILKTTKKPRRSDVLIFIPTFNELGNPTLLVEKINELHLGFDILFLDDASPDGTGDEIDRLVAKHSHVGCIHRSGKLGIGTGHQIGINYAYDEGYSRLVTMDADFTHPPQYIPELFKNLGDFDLVVGSRHMMKDSLKGWHPFRVVMSKSAHFMTTQVLDLKFDSTNSFRLYRLDRIPQALFRLVESPSYSFFYESLFVIHFNKFKITEISMHLPPREAGSSKMALRDVLRSISYMWTLKVQSLKGQKTLVKGS
jgi:dolichol-phosphate mannosyltransferase